MQISLEEKLDDVPTGYRPTYSLEQEDVRLVSSRDRLTNYVEAMAVGVLRNRSEITWYAMAYLKAFREGPDCTGC